MRILPFRGFPAAATVQPPAVPANLVPPTIPATLDVGGALTDANVDMGAWHARVGDAGLSFSLRVLRGTTAVATSLPYTVVSADVATGLRVGVTATALGQTGAEALSGMAAVIGATGPVSLADDFNRADGDINGANGWARIDGSAAATISGNRLAAGSGSYAVYKRGDMPGRDLRITVTFLGSTWSWVCFRMVDAGNWLGWRHSSLGAQLVHYQNGVENFLATYPTAALGAETRVEIVGNTVRYWRAGVETAPTSGSGVLPATGMPAGTGVGIQIREPSNSWLDTLTFAAAAGAVAAAPLLGALTAAGASIAEEAGPGAVVGAIAGKTAGSTLSLVGNAGGRFALSGATIVTGPNATDWETATFHDLVVEETLAGSPNSGRQSTIRVAVNNIAEAAVPAGRVAQLTADYAGRAHPAPQAYHDSVAAERRDPNAHPTLGPFTKTANKSGNWSDPSLWTPSGVPGAGAKVSLGTFDVTYDVESDAILAEVFGPVGSTFRLSRTVDARMRVDTVMLMGTTDFGTSQSPIPESATPGKPRAEIVFHQVTAPGATARLGLMTMGPVRIHGAAKREWAEANTVAAGATAITVPGASTFGWRAGDTLLVVGTTNAGFAGTDARYRGPTAYYGQISDNIGVQSANSFFLSQDEHRVIQSISGDTVTLASALSHAHAGGSDTLPDGTVVTLRPLVANLSRSVRFRGASASEDGSIDPGADLRVLQRRAHTMFMHHDDVDVRYAESKNMGRTDNTPSLLVPELPYPVEGYPGFNIIYPLYDRAPGTFTNGVPSNGAAVPLAVATNVRGRYPWHVHRTGAHLSRRQVNLVGLTAWAPYTEDPIPGWMFTQHSSRAAFERCVGSNGRGAGMVSEVGDEIGAWVDNLVAGLRGDGFPHGFNDRHEMYIGHNGSDGVGYENQARQVLLQGNVAAGCRFGALWHGLKAPLSNAQIGQGGRAPRDVDLRLWDPLSHQTQGPNAGMMDESYGARKPQIPPFLNNRFYACATGMAVRHRWFPTADDATPMLIAGMHCLNVGQAWRVNEYSNRYYTKDSLWIGTGSGTGAEAGTQTFGFTFFNCRVRDFTNAFDLGNMDYEGGVVDCNTAGCTNAFVQPNFVTYNAAVASHILRGTRADGTPGDGIMGNWEPHATDPNQARPRRYVNWTRAQLPLPYPLAPFGRKLPAGHPAVALGAAPFFTLGDGTNGANSTSPTGINLVLTAGQGRLPSNDPNAFRFYGIIRDSMGDRRYPDAFVSSQLSNNNVQNIQPQNVPRHLANMQPEQVVERVGCWMDGGTPKVRLWFTDADRLTHRWFQFSVDITLAGFSSAFLAQHMLAGPPPAPALPDKPEMVPVSQAPIATAARVPLALRSRTAIEVVSGQPLSHTLRANDGLANWSTVGGADAAHFAVSGAGVLTWASNGTRTTATPQDAGSNNAYEVTLRARNLHGQTLDVAHVVTVLPAARASASISDSFDRADENLEARAAYVVGTTGVWGVRSNRLATLADNASAHADLGSLGTAQQRLRVRFMQASTAMVLLRMEDENNWLGVRRYMGPDTGYHTRTQVVMRKAGTLTVLGTFNHAGDNPIDLRLVDDTLHLFYPFGSNEGLQHMPVHPREATAVLHKLPANGIAAPAPLKLPADAPKGHKVGLRGGEVRNPWVEDLTLEALPS